MGARISTDVNVRPTIGARLRERGVRYAFRVAIDRLTERVAGVYWRIRFRFTCLFQNVRPGKRLDIFGPIVMRSPAGLVELGDDVQLISSSWRSSASGVGQLRLRTFQHTAQIIFGDHATMSGGSITARSKTIRIGAKTMIGPDCLFVDSDFHAPWPPEERHH